MDTSGRQELLKAIFDDHEDEVRRLLAAGASLEADPRHGSTPMRVACQRGAIRSLRVLLDSGADANERITYKSPVDKRIERDFTPLFYATSVEVIDLLVVRGVDVNAVSATGLSALMRFSHFGNSELVDALLRHGANVSLRQHKKRGRKAMSALELSQDSLAFWESLPKKDLKPEAELLIEGHRKTVELLRNASDGIAAS